MDIAEKVRMFRTEQGMSMDMLAKKAKISKGVISKIENKKSKNVGVVTLGKIAKGLGKEITDLL